MTLQEFQSGPYILWFCSGFSVIFFSLTSTKFLKPRHQVKKSGQLNEHVALNLAKKKKKIPCYPLWTTISGPHKRSALFKDDDFVSLTGLQPPFVGRPVSSPKFVQRIHTDFQKPTELLKPLFFRAVQSSTLTELFASFLPLWFCITVKNT